MKASRVRYCGRHRTDEIEVHNIKKTTKNFTTEADWWDAILLCHLDNIVSIRRDNQRHTLNLDQH